MDTMIPAKGLASLPSPNAFCRKEAKQQLPHLLAEGNITEGHIVEGLLVRTSN